MFLCEPSQNALLELDLQPHSQACLVSVALNFSGAKPTVLCDPSQKGWLRAAPAGAPPIVLPSFDINAIPRLLLRGSVQSLNVLLLLGFQLNTSPTLGGHSFGQISLYRVGTVADRNCERAIALRLAYVLAPGPPDRLPFASRREPVAMNFWASARRRWLSSVIISNRRVIQS
jgi:hypothetical protein